MLANKRELYQLCERIGVDTPRTCYPASMADVREFIRNATFPIVIKAAESWLLPEGGRTTVVAQTPEQVDAHFRDECWPESNLMLQEYIDPERGEDWFLHTYRSARCRVDFTGRKLRSFPAFAGPTTLGKAIENATLRRQAAVLLEAISYAGIADLDFRLDRRDGRYKLLDFNPRIGAQFRLFEDRAGIDVARALYLDLTGSSVPNFRKIEARTFIAEFHDFAASVSYLRKGKLTFREWRESLRGKRELAWFSLRDLLPCLVMLVRLLWRQARRIVRWRAPRNCVKRVPRYVAGRSHAQRCRAPNRSVGAHA
jgi:D-aspartate ligase